MVKVEGRSSEEFDVKESVRMLKSVCEVYGMKLNIKYIKMTTIISKNLNVDEPFNIKKELL